MRQKCLKGEALESVRALLMTTNVEGVTNVLRRRFGCAKHIIKDLMQNVMSAPSVKEDRPITMIRFAEGVFWSDSQAVLKWIRSDARRYQTFVAHRIAEILDQTSPTDWRWIPTELNVADDATQSKKQDNLENTSLWFQGPEFLWRPEIEWPHPKTIDIHSTAVINEMKKECCFSTRVETPMIDSSRFASWSRITRVVAWMLRFVDRCQGKPSATTTSELTGPEIERAEKHMIQLWQREVFPEEW